MVDIQFLYFEDCPSHDRALARLKQVMHEVDVNAPVQVTRVETDEAAQRLQFVGSPTIRVNGQDIDPTPKDTDYRLACRVYRLDDGRISPLPSTDMIRRALMAHAQGENNNGSQIRR